jgi:hypothetical protein
LIDYSKIREISREYFENDVSVQKLVQYLHSEEFIAAWNVFKASSEVEDIFEWMKNHEIFPDVELEKLSRQLNEIIPHHVRANEIEIENLSFASFSDEIKAQIMLDKINAQIDKLIENGNDFAQLYLILKVSRPALEKLFEAEEIGSVITSLEQLGIDIDDLKNIVYELLRWQ